MHWEEVAVFDANASSLGVDEFDLMRFAGEALAEEVAKISGEGGVLFLCGPGNNGGDGFVAACSDPLAGRHPGAALGQRSTAASLEPHRLTASSATSLMNTDHRPSFLRGAGSSCKPIEQCQVQEHCISLQSSK